MRDIGKIVVPDAILKKPGRLTKGEFALMKRHASEGGRIVHEILDGYEESFEIIKENSGIHFDPVIAQEFLNIKEKAAAVNESYKALFSMTMKM